MPITSARPVRVISIASGKGGVGKTNISVNLATSMAKRGKKVILLDADLGLANVDVLLGLRPKYNLSHVLDGEKSLSDIALTGPFGLTIIPAASGVLRMAELSPAENAGIVTAFDEYAHSLDTLIIDNAAGINDTVISFCRASQEIVVVVCDEPASLTDAYALIKVLNQEYKIDRFRILANMVQNENEARSIFAKITFVTDKYLDVVLDFMGSVPFDLKLRDAVKQQKAVTDRFPLAESSKALERMSKRMERWPISTRNGSNASFFWERLIEYSSAKGV